MNRLRRRNIVTGAVAVGLMASGALAADPTQNQPPTPSSNQQDLQSQVNELKAEVAQLKAQAPRTPQVDDAAAVQAAIQDADRHSELFDGGLGTNAGWTDRRFFIKSDDGNFVLRPWIHIQIRDGTAWRQDEKDKSDDDTQNGLELRRARLGFDGHIFGPDLNYFINWATFRGNGSLTVKNSGSTVGTTTSPVGGLPVLEEAWVLYNFHDTPWAIHAGQIHDPFDHESIMGSKFRAPETSLQGDIFANTDTFTQAVTGVYNNNGPIRVEAGITDGIRAANTNFEDDPNNGILYDGGFAGRVEWKLMGDWKDYNQLTAYGDKSDLLVLGSGNDYSYGGNYYSWSHTLDVQYATPCGFFAYVCYLGRYTEHNPGIPLGAPVSTAFGSPNGNSSQDTYEPSVDCLLAYLIGGKFEPFVRYEYMDLKGTPAGSQNNVHDISAGANYYFYGHNVKFTGMATYLPNGIPVNNDSSDVLISNRKAEVILIAQLQLLL